jgi:RNA polymerase sigma-70 factor (ECF subfamily)
MTSAVPPNCLTRSAVSASRSPERATTATATPPSASPSAIARPMPRPAPVTSAVLPPSEITMRVGNELPAVLTSGVDRGHTPPGAGPGLDQRPAQSIRVRPSRYAGAMAPVEHGVYINRTPTLDPDSAEWLGSLRGTEAEREVALVRLHDLLLRIARSEVRRRSSHLHISGPELEDLAHQAAADALVAITAKLGQFRGESRFTTWAYKFVIFEVSTKIGRHFWRNPTVVMNAEDWDRLPDRFGLEPARESEWRDLVAALHRAVDEVLTDRQRRIFVAIVLNGVPLDALVIELGSNRNAIYKMLFDARRKLRSALVANGHLDSDSTGPS